MKIFSKFSTFSLFSWKFLDSRGTRHLIPQVRRLPLSWSLIFTMLPSHPSPTILRCNCEVQVREYCNQHAANHKQDFIIHQENRIMRQISFHGLTTVCHLPRSQSIKVLGRRTEFIEEAITCYGHQFWKLLQARSHFLKDNILLADKLKSTSYNVAFLYV